jgi:radical SAM superfamily enzyme YgiQ (UPF0313 family)
MDIVLATLNARYHHSSFGLRYLYANLGEFQNRAVIKEFVIKKSATEILSEILALDPKIVGFGVYIWNTTQTQQVIRLLKSQRPDILVVIGGPEVSFEIETQEITKIVDYVFKGESDFLFREFIQNWTIGILPENKIVSGPLPDIKKIASPYGFYTDEDIKNRVIYVEASRGCPYKCEYCLSSLDVSVRNFDTELFLKEIDRLVQRGARQFKFVDRTFNLSPSTSTKILQFFLDRIHLGLFLHFEMVPDRLPDELKLLVRQFPKGSLQFEIGIQTWSPVVARNVSRRQDYSKIIENFKFLKLETGVHTHADLIVGLPGETFESFKEGFDALSECAPDEIQVGILKRLKGTPIIRHDAAFEMVYSSEPPFQILKNKNIDFELMQKMEHFADFWDLYANSGNFLGFTQILKSRSKSIFEIFWTLSQFSFKKFQRTHSIALIDLVENAFNFLRTELAFSEDQAAQILAEDYTRGVKRELPKFLKHIVIKGEFSQPRSQAPARQQKHLLTAGQDFNH